MDEALASRLLTQNAYLPSIYLLSFVVRTGRVDGWVDGQHAGRASGKAPQEEEYCNERGKRERKNERPFTGRGRKTEKRGEGEKRKKERIILVSWLDRIRDIGTQESPKDFLASPPTLLGAGLLLTGDGDMG